MEWIIQFNIKDKSKNMEHKSYKHMTFEILPENFVDQVLKPLSSIGIGPFQIFYFT